MVPTSSKRTQNSNDSEAVAGFVCSMLRWTVTWNRGKLIDPDGLYNQQSELNRNYTQCTFSIDWDAGPHSSATHQIWSNNLSCPLFPNVCTDSPSVKKLCSHKQHVVCSPVHPIIHDKHQLYDAVALSINNYHRIIFEPCPLALSVTLIFSYPHKQEPLPKQITREIQHIGPFTVYTSLHRQ